MGGRHFQVPGIVRARAAVAGVAGERWVEDLPETVAALETRWSIVVGAQLSGGTAAFVARAVTAAGAPAVVKVAVPGLGFARRVRTLATAEGRGYVRLLAQDPEYDAVLLEALGVSLDRSGLAPEVQLSTLCALLLQAWTVPREDDDPVQDKAAELAGLVERLWEELRHPCAEATIDYALYCARRRSAALEPDRCVVVHGDAAAANALRVLGPRPGAEAGFVFVDPDSFLGDPTYDLGVALRDWTPQLLAAPDPAELLRRYCHVLATGSGMDPAAIWEWGYLERVSTGLFALSLGAEQLALPMLSTAEAIIEHHARDR
jgi:streptomycin 6-kinase